MDNQKNIRIFILAGESSGDYLGAQLITSLKKECKDKKKRLVINGVGGPLMHRKGIKSPISIMNISTIGLIETVPVIYRAIKLLNQISKKIIEFKPNILVTIDMPGFSMKLAERLQELRRSRNIKFIHYVSPTIWAYKEKRLYKMEKMYDMVLALFPFEPALYKDTNLICKYVGHPISDYNWIKKDSDLKYFRNKHRISQDQEIIGVLPGSRVIEVKRMAPIFIGAINKFIKSRDNRNTIVMFPVVSDRIKNLILKYQNIMKFDFRIVRLKNIEEKILMMRSFSKAITKSGTASMELVFAEVPMISGYKLNNISYLIAKYWLKMQNNIKFITMANILLNKEIVPEYIQGNCTVNNLYQGLKDIDDASYCKRQISEYKKVQTLLSVKKQISSSDYAAKSILSLLF